MEPRWQRTTFPTPRHRNVHGLLARLISAGAADLFADACDIAQREPPFRSTTHLVAHLLREVEGEVLIVLVGLPGVPPELHQRQKAKEGDGHRKRVDAILRALDLEAHGVATAWREYAGGGHAWHRHAHLPRLWTTREPTSEFVERVAGFVDILDAVLRAAESRYAALLDSITPRLAISSPTKDDVEAVSRYLAAGVTALHHVFDRIDATWLTGLRSSRAFAEPPDVLVHDGGSFSYPDWPQGRYLVRVASDLPGEVATTIEGVPAVENESVHLLFLEAGAKMPPADAARIARHEAKWLGGRPRWNNSLLVRAAADLAACLTEGGELEAALTLLRAALSLAPPDKDKAWRGPSARTDSWNYGELVKKTVPALAAKDAGAARALVFELIEGGGVEGAWGWRQRMDGGGHPGLDEPIEILFASLRDLHLSRVATDPTELRAVIGDLEGRGSRVYRRLALHLLRVHGEHARDLVVARATDPKLLGAGDEDDDITLMIGAQFPGLAKDDQERVLAALRANASEDSLAIEFGDRLDAARLREVGRHRLLKWLHALGSARPLTVVAEYEALVTELGVPERASRRALSGPNPPRRAAELLDLSDAELLTYLRDWAPTSRDPFEPSREGLARELQKCVTQQVERFAALARDFRGLDASYVAHLVWGLHDVTKVRSDDASKPATIPPIDWASVLDLLEWVAQQTSASDEEGAAGNWTWPRRMAVDLVEDALTWSAPDATTNTSRAWVVLRRLVRDVDPTPARDAECGDDIDSFALNTVRGEALHAAIRAAASLKDAGPSRATLLSEVLTEIGASAHPSTEPSAALRCVLAMRFSAVFDVDTALASRVASELFPTSADASDEQRVAWSSFLRCNSSHPATHEVLRRSYGVAVDTVGSADPRLASRLGEHLIWLAFRKTLDIADVDSPMRRFVANAPAPARHAALDDFGRALHRTETPIEEAVLAPIREIWEQWFAAVLGRDDVSDLAAFGWWFASGHFDAGWALRALEGVLDATGGNIDWDHEVMTKLSTLAASDPPRVARCLALVVESTDPWQTIRNRKEIRATLEALLGTSADGEARAIASRLVARQFMEFQDIGRDVQPTRIADVDAPSIVEASRG